MGVLISEALPRSGAQGRLHPGDASCPGAGVASQTHLTSGTTCMKFEKPR